MPDFYRGDSWPATESEITEDLAGDRFGSWFGSKMSPEFWTQFNKDVTVAVDKLTAAGCTKFCVMGFCWGGKAACVAAKTGTFSAAVSLHGAAHTPEDVSESKAETMFITVPKDDYYPESMHEQHRKLGAIVDVVEGGYHGFVVRGDFDGNAELKTLADKAIADTCAFFSKSTA